MSNDVIMEAPHADPNDDIVKYAPRTITGVDSIHLPDLPTISAPLPPIDDEMQEDPTSKKVNKRKKPEYSDETTSTSDETTRGSTRKKIPRNFLYSQTPDFKQNKKQKVPNRSVKKTSKKTNKDPKKGDNKKNKRNSNGLLDAATRLFKKPKKVTEDNLQGEKFLLPLKEKDKWAPKNSKSPKKGGIKWEEVIDNKTFIKYYLHCPYDTKSGGLKGGNYMDKISEKFGLKKIKSDIKIDRPDFSKPDKTSLECKNAEMHVDSKNLSYEGSPRYKPKYNDSPALCYMTGFPINQGSGTEADGYHCEHYLIIGDIGNSLRLALDEYKEILKKMVDKEKFEEFQGLSKELWKEVYKPSQPPSNLLKADYIFVNLNHKDLSVSVNYHNIIRMMTTLVFGHLNENSHSNNFRDRFLEDIMSKWGSEEAYLHSRIKFLFEQAEDFCELWTKKINDIMRVNSSASVLTTIRYLHIKKKEQLDKISGKKPSSTALKSITSFLKEKIGENAKDYLKKKLSKALSVFNNIESAAKKMLISGKVKMSITGGGSDSDSDFFYIDDDFDTMGKISDVSTPTKSELKRYDTAPTENVIETIGNIEDGEIIKKFSEGEAIMIDDYNKLSDEIKKELLRQAIETTIEESKGLYTIEDFRDTEGLSYDISLLIEEGNNPPVKLEDKIPVAHGKLLDELYNSNTSLLNEIKDNITPKKWLESEELKKFLMGDEMIEFNELLEKAHSILQTISRTARQKKTKKRKARKRKRTKKNKK